MQHFVKEGHIEVVHVNNFLLTNFCADKFPCVQYRNCVVVSLCIGGHAVTLPA
jgi:hypothetical protein